MSYVPELVALYEIEPYIILALDNDTIRVAVEEYRKKRKKRNVIIKKYGKIEDWNTSEVTDMSRMFWDAHNFNQDISKWDVSSVTNMEDMFMCAKSFNQDISGWDVSKVTDMNEMFYDEMFYKADNFNLENAPWYHE